jgi:hypothetical protein
MNDGIELTPKLKAFISGIVILTCGILIFFIGDLLSTVTINHIGMVVYCLGVVISTTTWILGLKK